jgi:hypothetical protein
MLTVSVKRLHDELVVAPVYEPPEINAGAQYIYDKLYDCHVTEIATKLSEINFEAFNLGDLDDFLTLNKDKGRHAYAVGQVAESFKKLKPAVIAGTFI